MQEIESALEMDEDELKDELPKVLDGIDVDELYEERPDLIARTIRRIEKVDVAEFATDTPEASERMQDYIWKVTSRVTATTESVRDMIEQQISGEEMRVNFDADDSPLEGHIVVDGEDISIDGGNETLGDADIYIEGPTDVLVGLMTGTTDPTQGFMAGEFEMDGDVNMGMKMAPILQQVTSEVRNPDE